MNKMIISSKLDFVAATVEHLEAELQSREMLSSLLRVNIPEDWPPGEYDPPAIKYFLDQLKKNPDAYGWYNWYAILRSGRVEPGTLVGAGGFFGPPNPDGQIEIGYSIVPKFAGRGYATELVSFLIEYTATHANVKRIIATWQKKILAR